MTISEPIEEAGFFWLPDNPERRVPGVLRVSQWGAVTLETMSLSPPVVRCRSFGDPGLGGYPKNFKRIVGITKIGAVTLDDCSERSHNTRLGGGLSTSVLDANWLFVGVGYGRDTEVTFSELRFSIRGLDEWLRISGIEVTHHESRNISLRFALPEAIKLKLSDEIRLEFNFDGQLPTGFNIKEARVAQRAYISLTSRTEKPLDDFLPLAQIIRDLFSFALAKTTHIDSLTGYSDEIKQHGKSASWRVPVRIHFRNLPFANAFSENGWHDMLFVFPDIQQEVESVFAKWIEAYNSHEAVFRRYFLLGLDTTMDLERRFCVLVEGMAAIHKRISGQKRSNLRFSIKEMMKPFQRFFGTDEEMNNFIGQVVKARHDLIHLHEESEGTIGSVDDLFTLNCRLEALFCLHLLHTIGIEDAQLDRIVENNRRLRANLERRAGSTWG